MLEKGKIFKKIARIQKSENLNTKKTKQTQEGCCFFLAIWQPLTVSGVPCIGDIFV